MSREAGIVVIQDYLHPVSFVLALIFERLSDKLESSTSLRMGRRLPFESPVLLLFLKGFQRIGA